MKKMDPHKGLNLSEIRNVLDNPSNWSESETESEIESNSSEDESLQETSENDDEEDEEDIIFDNTIRSKIVERNSMLQENFNDLNIKLLERAESPDTMVPPPASTNPWSANRFTSFYTSTPHSAPSSSHTTPASSPNITPSSTPRLKRKVIMGTHQKSTLSSNTTPSSTPPSTPPGTPGTKRKAVTGTRPNSHQYNKRSERHRGKIPNAVPTPNQKSKKVTTKPVPKKNCTKKKEAKAK